MADFKFKKSSGSEGTDPESKLQDEVRTRQEHKIEFLDDDEELIDTGTFHKMHERLAIAAVGEDEIAPPAAAPPEPPEEVLDELLLDELLLEEVVTELPPDKGEATFSGSCGATPKNPAQVANVEAEIRGAGNRDDVVRLALRLGGRFAGARAMLVVNRGIIAGIRGEGGGLEDRIEGVMISTQMDGLFGTAANTGETCAVAAPFGATDAQILGAMGRRDAHEAVVVPVVIRGRVVNLYYADNGPDQVPRTSIAALEAVARCVAEAYERLILEKKLGS